MDHRAVWLSHDVDLHLAPLSKGYCVSYYGIFAVHSLLLGQDDHLELRSPDFNHAR